MWKFQSPLQGKDGTKTKQPWGIWNKQGHLLNEHLKNIN